MINQHSLEHNIIGDTELQQYFNYSMEKLMVYSEYPLNSVELVINRRTYDLFKFTKVTDNIWLLEFGNNTVNFSKIDNAKLHIKNSQKNTINIVGIHHNIFMFTSDKIRQIFVS